MLYLTWRLVIDMSILDRYEELDMSMCNKCSGRGFIEMYKHVQEGVCFSCNGTGQYTFNGSYSRPITDSNVLENRKNDPFIDKINSSIKKRDSFNNCFTEEQRKKVFFENDILNDVEKKLNDFISNCDRLGPSYHRGILNNLNNKLIRVNVYALNELDAEKYHSITDLITKRLALL